MGHVLGALFLIAVGLVVLDLVLFGATVFVFLARFISEEMPPSTDKKSTILNKFIAESCLCLLMILVLDRDKDVCFEQSLDSVYINDKCTEERGLAQSI